MCGIRVHRPRDKTAEHRRPRARALVRGGTNPRLIIAATRADQVLSDAINYVWFRQAAELTLT